VISGIIRVVKSGGRWVDAPACYGPRKTLYNRFVRWAEKGIWQELFVTLAAVGRATCRGSDRQHAHEGAPLGGGRKRGAFLQAIGVSRGGRTSKLHALTDREGRPLRFLLTPGNAADARAALQLLDALPARAIVLADKAYDGDAIRRLIEDQGAVPNIPSKPIGAGRAASPKCSTELATPSSACFAASRTGGASPPDTTSSPPTSWPQSASPPPLHGGYESGAQSPERPYG
jgi:transposase